MDGRTQIGALQLGQKPPPVPGKGQSPNAVAPEQLPVDDQEKTTPRNSGGGETSYAKRGKAIHQSLRTNRFEYRDDHAVIIITTKRGGTVHTCEVLIDAEDLPFLRDRGASYCLSSNGYVYTRTDRQKTGLHRLLTNAPRDMVVDHINRNRLDNRKLNLRVVTQSVNASNFAGTHKRSKTGLRGVSLHRRSKKDKYSYTYWRARVNLNGKTIYLGTFKDQQEAADAVQKKLAEIHGFSV